MIGARLSSALLLLAACSAAKQRTTGEPSKATPVRIGYQKYLSFAPLFIAREEGFFRNHGVDVEFIDMFDGNAGTAAIVSGALDVLAGPANPGLLNAIARGAPVRLVADKGSIPFDGCSPMGLIGRPGIDLAARSGPTAVRRISPSRATFSIEYFVERALATASLAMASLETVHLPTPILSDALARGSVDLVATTEPGLTRLVDAGNRMLLDASEVVPGLSYAFIVFGDRLIRSDRDLGRRFIQAYLEGIHQYELGKTDRNLEIVAAATGDDPNVLRRACWAPFRTSDPDSVAFGLFQDWAVGRNALARRLSMAELWDGSFLHEAIRPGGLPPAPTDRRGGG